MVYQITRDRIAFPDPRLAEEDGLLAIGGDLSVDRLLAAYRQGIYPWYTDEYPILWWSPDPRFVLFPEELRVSRSIAKLLRHNDFRVTVNRAFRQVVRSCAKVPRRGQQGTWITADMIAAYQRLFEKGHAVSVESWLGDELAGGLYGVIIGRCFFGESMFAWEPNASKIAFVKFVEFLRENGIRVIDCQMRTAHLERFGGRFIPLAHFLDILSGGCDEPMPSWPVSLWSEKT
ncbi:MAG TPA: leucyl/phenylalanyl-tRNA--protein transferase [bacterium]|nr:leucyl/phenylalanyl-tRNA--protein transferase [bacterium]